MKLKKVLKVMKKAQVIGDQDIQLLDSFSTFLRSQGKQPSTVESYRRDALHFLEFIAGHSIGLTEVESGTLSFFQKELISSHERGNSIRRSIIGIRQFFRFLSLSKVIAESPLDLCPIPERNDQLPADLCVDDIESLLESISVESNSFKRTRDTLILSLLAFEGLKASELIELRRSDILRGIGHTSIKIHGQRERSINASEETSRHVALYLDQLSILMNEFPSLSKSDAHLIVSFKGRDAAVPVPKLTRHGLKFIVYELGVSGGMKHLNSELLRHFAVGYLISLERSPEEIMNHLGLRTLGNIGKHLAQHRLAYQQTRSLEKHDV